MPSAGMAGPQGDEVCSAGTAENALEELLETTSPKKTLPEE